MKGLEYDHNCKNPMCDEHSLYGDEYCGELKGHEMPHIDPDTGVEFTLTENDEPE